MTEHEHTINKKEPHPVDKLVEERNTARLDPMTTRVTLDLERVR